MLWEVQSMQQENFYAGKRGTQQFFSFIEFQT